MGIDGGYRGYGKLRKILSILIMRIRKSIWREHSSPAVLSAEAKAEALAKAGARASLWLEIVIDVPNRTFVRLSQFPIKIKKGETD